MVTHEESDDRLMARAAGGDTQAFDAIVRRHQHRLQRFATRMLSGDSARGADVAVGAFLRLWEKRREYRTGGNLLSWLLTTVYRLCLDALAQERCRPVGLDDFEVVDATAAVADRVERTALAQAVRDAVMELPPEPRAVVVLSVYEGLSYEAIAEALEIPVGTVASRKNHAIATLRRRLAAWEER
jgi:RNA polymerase sigma-70 factor (ECF subfamily)